jgi:hypothetical protein
MNSEPITIFLGQFVEPPVSVDADWIYDKAQWLVGHLYRHYRGDFFIPPVLRREHGEIFGLLKRAGTCYRACATFNEELHPAWVRFAIVNDKVSKPGDIEPEGAWFSRAGERARLLLGKARSAGWCYIFGLDDEVAFNEVLSELASLVHVFRSMWSQHQNNVIRLYKEMGRQAAVAERLGITQQAVSDILKRARWKEIKRAEELIGQVLEGG